MLFSSFWLLKADNLTVCWSGSPRSFDACLAQEVCYGHTKSAILSHR